MLLFTLILSPIKNCAHVNTYMYILKHAYIHICSLLARLLDSNPKTRITVGEAAGHPWLAEVCAPNLQEMILSVTNHVTSPFSRLTSSDAFSPFSTIIYLSDRTLVNGWQSWRKISGVASIKAARWVDRLCNNTLLFFILFLAPISTLLLPFLL